MRILSKYNGVIFLISFAVLLFELSLTRVFSVTLWYHFGFLIISTALLGFGISGVLVSLWGRFRKEYQVDKTLGWLSVCLSLSVVACFWALQQIPFDPFSLYADKMQLLYMPVTYIIVSVPFFFAGLSLSLLFTRFPSRINRLYAFDLSGAALGCVAIIFTMRYFGGSSSVLFAASIAALSAIICFGKAMKAPLVFSVALLLATTILAWRPGKVIPLRITDNKAPGLRKMVPEFTAWNTFSRIDFYVEKSTILPQKKSPFLTIDQGTAASGLDFDLNPDVKTVLQQFPADSLYGSCLPYLNNKNPSILIIGSGCGSQVLDALHHGAEKITAVEINPIINNLVTKNQYWADLFHQPRVHLVTDEGRNYVRSSKENYDAIISVHTISNAAIASGALSLSENYVLTKEAFNDYFYHLRDSGMIYFTRPEFQIPRLFATGREVLEENGIKDISSHFFAFTTQVPKAFMGRKSFFSVFVMSKKPLTKQQVAQMNAFVNLSKATPGIILYDPYFSNKNIYDTILGTGTLKELYGSYPFEIAPATDNAPFFNHHTRWSSLNWQSFEDIFSQKKMGRLALEDKPIAEVTLIVLLAQVLIISAIFILLPLWKFSSTGMPAKKTVPCLLYFSGLGCGFIIVEIVLIQLFGLLLGEPVYTFAIVLGALLGFTGVGAYISGKFPNPGKTINNAIPILAILLLLASFFLPLLLQRAIALPISERIVLALFLIMPLGILLGMPFPSGIRLVSKQEPDLISWAWGVNGFFTVIGTVIALMLSMMIGFRAVLWIAVVIYLLSMVAFMKTTKR